ncbi:MAG: GmrSD restriction endonuclease domain-containing protein [Promethearchaeia archaeon]
MAENPGTKNVGKLLENVHDGSYVIPYFQRGFEWSPGMVCDLIQSILQDYYTGLLLMWELDREDAEEQKWDPIWGAELKKDIPTHAILDGQQRLSSLYYAIYNPKETFPNRKSYYVFTINLTDILNENYEDAVDYNYYGNYREYQSQERIQKNKDDWAESGEIPLAVLSADDPNDPNQPYIDSTDFEEWIEKYLEENKDNLPERVTTHQVYQIFNGLLNYNFVFYPLGNDRALQDICNIFARVNEKGMKLSTFDLMNAFLYPHGIHLRKNLWENLENEKLKSIDSSMKEYLLKLPSLIKQNYCSSKYLYNLVPNEEIIRKDENGNKYKDILVEDSEEFRSLWNKSSNYAEKARQIIMNTGQNEFGAIKDDFIPNTTIIPVLGAILWLRDKKGIDKTKEFKKNLKRWYWSAVLSEDYSGSSDSVMSRDFRDWKGWIEDGEDIEISTRINEEFITDLDFKETTKGSAQYNSIICILALNYVKDFYKGRIVDTGDFSKEKINDHHIFPKGVKELDSEKSIKFDEYKDSIVNRTLLLDETNNKIKNKKPSEYIEQMKNKLGSEEKVKSIFEEHLINEKAYEHMKNDDFDKFVKERERTIKRYIISKLDLRRKTHIDL